MQLYTHCTDSTICYDWVWVCLLLVALQPLSPQPKFRPEYGKGWVPLTQYTLPSYRSYFVQVFTGQDASSASFNIFIVFSRDRLRPFSLFTLLIVFSQDGRCFAPAIFKLTRIVMGKDASVSFLPQCCHGVDKMLPSLPTFIIASFPRTRANIPL